MKLFEFQVFTRYTATEGDIDDNMNKRWVKFRKSTLSKLLMNERPQFSSKAP